MSKQSSSDPLPFVQIDRAVEPAAALLAGHLKVTHQHAIGSLYAFWKLCSDPRELEGIVSASSGEPQVVLESGDVALRFELASGSRVEPDVLVRLGLLELTEGRYRVRGMSRYLGAVADRLRARKAAKAGGKARAAAPRSRNGSFVVAGAPAGPLAGVPAGPSAGDSQPNNQPAASRQPALEVRGQRSEVREKTKSTAPAAPTPRESDALCQDFLEAVGAAYVWQGAKDGVALADLRKAADLEEVRARWRKGLRATGWLQVRTVAQLRAKWNDLAGDVKAPASLKAPIPAESVDWGGVQSGEVLL